MVEEALVAAGAAGLRPLRRVPEEAQGGERAIARLRPRHPALLDAVGISGEREPDRGDRGEALRRIAIGREAVGGVGRLPRSEEHTSELQSLMRISYAVFCLKKK